MVHVYTGDGKGKTTAALGLALRACGQGWRVRMIQFMKNRDGCGEQKIAKCIPNFELMRFGLACLVNPDKPSEEDMREAAKAFSAASETILSGRYDMVVLDELNVAVDLRLIPIEDVLRIVRGKPDSVELVLTGRNAHPDLIEMADYASEIRELKHPFKRNAAAREGIEY
jgi:cob(I)alamin adenosyltransferase